MKKGDLELLKTKAVAGDLGAKFRLAGYYEKQISHFSCCADQDMDFKYKQDAYCLYADIVLRIGQNKNEKTFGLNRLIIASKEKFANLIKGGEEAKISELHNLIGDKLFYPIPGERENLGVSISIMARALARTPDQSNPYNKAANALSFFLKERHFNSEHNMSDAEGYMSRPNSPPQPDDNSDEKQLSLAGTYSDNFVNVAQHPYTEVAQPQIVAVKPSNRCVIV